MRSFIPAVLVLATPAALSAQAAPRLAPQNSVLFARTAEAAPAEAPSTGFKPYSWPRALTGAALGAGVGAALARYVLASKQGCADATCPDDRPYALAMVSGTILGFIVGGRTGKRPTE